MSQVSLLRARGELEHKKFRFDAVLTEPAHGDVDILTNTGLGLKRETKQISCGLPASMMLKVAKVAEMRWGRRTPAARWNSEQAQPQGCTSSRTIEIGDRVCAVNDAPEGYDDVLQELSSGREARSIQLERELADVFFSLPGCPGRCPGLASSGVAPRLQLHPPPSPALTASVLSHHTGNASLSASSRLLLSPDMVLGGSASRDKPASRRSTSKQSTSTRPPSSACSFSASRPSSDPGAEEATHRSGGCMP